MPIDRAGTLRNAEKLLREGKLDAAIGEYLRIVEEQPRDWNLANTLGDLYVRAGQADKAIEQFIRIADNLHEDNVLPKAAALYKKILKLRPDHEHALLQLAQISASQGLYADARASLSVVLERRKMRGDVRGAAQVRVMLAALDPADLVCRIEGARARVEIGDTAGAVRDLKDIAGELTECGRQTDAVEALGQAALLDPDDRSVRTQLFDLHLLVEDFARARECAITKDQFKWLASTFGRLGRPEDALDALRQAAEIDPGDAGLRAELSRAAAARDEPAAAALDKASVPAADGNAPPADGNALPPEGNAPPPEGNAPAAGGNSPAAAGNSIYELSANSIDIESILAELESDNEAPGATAHVPSESVDVDVRVVSGDEDNDDVEQAEQVVVPRAKAVLDPLVAQDLDGAFAQLRNEAAQRSSLDVAEAALQRGLALREKGDIDVCIAALTSAAKAPSLRFAAASSLGRIYKQRGMSTQALEWLERAAQAPAPSPSEYHALLFELAEGLEGAGEVARALAVCLELLAHAGSYRDVRSRVDRLTKAQARG